MPQNLTTRFVYGPTDNGHIYIRCYQGTVLKLDQNCNEKCSEKESFYNDISKFYKLLKYLKTSIKHCNFEYP